MLEKSSLSDRTTPKPGQGMHVRGTMIDVAAPQSWPNSLFASPYQGLIPCQSTSNYFLKGCTWLLLLMVSPHRGVRRGPVGPIRNCCTDTVGRLGNSLHCVHELEAMRTHTRARRDYPLF